MKSNLNLTNRISYKRLYFTTFLKKYLGESRPLLVLFRHFHIPIRLQIKKIGDVVHGIRTRVLRMVVADRSTDAPILIFYNLYPQSHQVEQCKITWPTLTVWVMLLFSTSILMAKEAFQMMHSQKQYFFNWENWVQVPTILYFHILYNRYFLYLENALRKRPYYCIYFVERFKLCN